jgi:SM-20-related protein
MDGRPVRAQCTGTVRDGKGLLHDASGDAADHAEDDGADAAADDDEAVGRGLARGEHVVVDAWRGPAAAVALRAELLVLLAERRFEDAGIGGGRARVLASDVRRDRVCWFDRTGDASLGIAPGAQVALFLARVDVLMAHLNRTCFLSLRRIECHAACYEPGAYYAAHKDAFVDDARRVVSWCYYLNDAWDVPSGGCLRLHGATTIDVAPVMDRLVVFSSAAQSHEVLPTTARRLSMTGWLSRARAP